MGGRERFPLVGEWKGMRVTTEDGRTSQPCLPPGLCGWLGEGRGTGESHKEKERVGALHAVLPGPLAADPAPQMALRKGLTSLDPPPVVSSGRSAEATGIPREVVSTRD